MSEERKFLPQHLGRIYQMQADGGNSSFTIGAFRGRLQWVVWDDGRKTFDAVIDKNFYQAFKEELPKLPKMNSDTRETLLLVGDWDKDAKKYNRNIVIVGGKNEQGEIYLELKSKEGAATRFIFRLPKRYDKGGDPLTAQQRSQTAFNYFKALWDIQLPQAELMCKFDVDPDAAKKYRKGGGNQGGGNRQSSPARGSDDGMFSDDDY